MTHLVSQKRLQDREENESQRSQPRAQTLAMASMESSHLTLTKPYHPERTVDHAKLSGRQTVL